MSGPRVLLSGVVLGQPMGGVRRHLAELVPRAAARLAAAGGELALLEGREGLPFDPGPAVTRLASDVPWRPTWLRALREGRALRAVLAEARRAGRPFDLVHTGHQPVPRGLGVPLALTIHDLRALRLSETPLVRRLLARRVLLSSTRRARLVTTVSEHVRGELIEELGLAPERVVVIGNGADHLPVLPRRPSPRVTLLHVGHVEPRKNLECAVRALALDPELGVLRLAGGAPGGEARRLRRLAVRLGVDERLELLGPVEDAALPALYAEAHALVLPSRLEGFGIPLLEAQRARLPVAYAAAGALGEVAGPGAVPFRPDDPRDCARALREALRTDGATLDAGRRHADGRRWDDCAARWVAAWSRAVGDAPGAQRVRR